ncbi:MAG: flavin reductase [Alistipes sp.]|nr:flavin reductase [Alistipes sp.]
MNGFKEIDPVAINDNFIKLIGSDWMLITAGNKDSYNTMTASWGGVGFMWNYPVAMAVIRPQRHTHSFTESQERMTLSFFSEEYRDALTYCGTHSGSKEDKITNAGLSVVFTANDTPAIEQARLVLECKKLYVSKLEAAHFIDREIVERWYPQGDYHCVYVMKIEKAYIKE